MRSRSVVQALVLTMVGLLAVVVPPAPPAAAADGTFTFAGRGYGHGRGMGQYGALGYAVDHGWSHSQILQHFYGGTSLRADAGNGSLSVELLRKTGTDTIVTGPSLRVNGTSAGAAAVRLVRVADGRLRYHTGPGCAGPWSDRGEVASGAVVSTTADPSSTANLLQLCEAGVDHGYRGTLRAVATGGTQFTVNTLPVNSYLRGVVPREMPASWGALGSGRGAQALRAQSVAARSYALAPRGVRASGAQTCDTTACQVYLGATTVTDAGARASLEHALSDAAVSATSGQVMRHGDGRIALTEFSSSTGGYSAGGTFPAVADAGDATASNPHRSWAVTFTPEELSARLGVGTVASVRVAARNGLGELGGRATRVDVTTTGGQVVALTGSQVRTRLGLKSDWFTVSGVSPAEAQSVVRALYEDLLGRPVDAAGLSTWSSALVSGTSRAALVRSLTRSEEYVRLRVREAYVDVLGRQPDAAGLNSWTRGVMSGDISVDAVALLFHRTPEFYQRSGGNDDAFVRRLYQVMLGRSASASEVAHWRGQIASSGRAAVASGVWWSREAANNRAGGYYEVFLGRAPDRAGKSSWGGVLLTRGEGAVREGIAGSVEYRNLALRRFP
ncbi:DUF4214 domain-containing protein [Cellulosimicrobium sp. Marseille-Q8652]